MTGRTAEDALLWQSLFQNVPVGIYRSKPDGTIVAVNPAAVQMFGYASQEEMKRLNARDLYVHPEDRQRWLEIMEREGLVLNFIAPMRCKDGRVIWVRDSARAVWDHTGCLLYIEGFLEDITERHALEERIQEQQRALLSLLKEPSIAEGALEQALPLICKTVSRVLRVARVNIWRRTEAYLRCVASFDQRGPDKWLGKRLKVGEDSDYMRALEEGRVIDAADVLKDPRTDELRAYWSSLGIASALDAPVRLHGKVVGVVCCEHVGMTRRWAPDEAVFASQVADLVAYTFLNAERAALVRELREMAVRDSLTGLYNRRYLEDMLERAFARAQRHSERHALLYIDLDRFKQINDMMGHPFGDQILQELAQYLQRVVRRGDLLARVGGDEFAVLAFHQDEKTAETTAHRLRESVERFFTSYQGRKFRITASVGIAMIDQETPSAADALSRADAACYIAKSQGGNQVYRFGEADMQWAQQTVQEMRRAQYIREALETGRLTLVFQPVVRISDGEWIFVEALVRLIEEGGELIEAEEFFPIAARFHLLELIDGWVAEHLLRNPPAWLQQKPLPLSINVSGTSLEGLEYEEILSELVRRYRSGIILELTERAVVQNAHILQQWMRTLRAMGCRFALDDFGFGFNTLERLSQMPFDFVKVNIRRFVRQGKRSLCQATLKAVRQIAGALRLKVVVEGVECREVVAWARAAGIPYAQGFFFAKPRANPLETNREVDR